MGGAAPTTCEAARAAARRQSDRGRSCRSLRGHLRMWPRKRTQRQHAATAGRGAGRLGWGGRPAGLRTVARPTWAGNRRCHARACTGRAGV
eukprot:131245-Prymnesium_polylepis.1